MKYIKSFNEAEHPKSSIKKEVESYINDILSDYKLETGFRVITNLHDDSYSFHFFNTAQSSFSDYKDDLIQFFSYMSKMYGVNDIVFVNNRMDPSIYDCKVNELENLPAGFKYNGILFSVYF